MGSLRTDGELHINLSLFFPRFLFALYSFALTAAFHPLCFVSPNFLCSTGLFIKTYISVCFYFLSKEHHQFVSHIGKGTVIVVVIIVVVVVIVEVVFVVVVMKIRPNKETIMMKTIFLLHTHSLNHCTIQKTSHSLHLHHRSQCSAVIHTDFFIHFFTSAFQYKVPR